MISSDSLPTHLALLCDQRGFIQTVIHDDFGLPGLSPGQPLGQWVDSSCRIKLLDFLADLRARGAALNWEFAIANNGLGEPLCLAGATNQDDLLVVFACSPLDTLFLLDGLLKTHHIPTAALQSAIKNQVPSVPIQGKMDAAMFEEISRLNNELVTLQRNLAINNVHLEQSNAEILNFNQELDLRIKERTAELASAKLQLEKKMDEVIEAQQSLQNLYTRFRIIADNAYDWEYWLDVDGQYLFYSPSCERITGYKPDDFRFNPDLLHQIIHPDDLPAWQKHCEEEAKEKTVKEIEFRIQHPNGSTVWIGHVCQPVYDWQNHYIGTRGSNRDITAQKLAGQALQSSEQRFREVLENSLDAAYRRNLQLDLYDYMSPVIEQITGWTVAEMTNADFAKIFGIIHPDDLQDIQQVIEQTLIECRASGRATCEHEYRLLCKDGQYRWLADQIYVLADDSGEPLYMSGTVRDVTGRKQAEEEIRIHTARAEALLHTAARLNAQLDLTTLLQTVCQEAAAALHAPAAWINLYDTEKVALSYASDDGMPPGFKERYQPVPRANYDKLYAQMGSIIVFPDQHRLKSLHNWNVFAWLEIHTLVVGSLIHEGQLIGTINVASFDQVRTFSQDELSSLQGLADQAALAIVKTLLFEQVSAGRQHMSALSQALIEVQENERRAIALELHDELGQILSAVKLSLDTILHMTDSASDEPVNRIKAMLDDLISRVRRMSLQLRPSMLDDMGLLPALQWLFNNYTTQNGAVLSFEQAGVDRRFSPKVEITTYRIIQEALTNVTRHAGNRQVDIFIYADEHILNLKIRDYGVGFDPVVSLSRGLSSGLSGMRERARMLGGEMTIESAPGKGTQLSVKLPVAPPSV